MSSTPASAAELLRYLPEFSFASLFNQEGVLKRWTGKAAGYIGDDAYLLPYFQEQQEIGKVYAALTESELFVGVVSKKPVDCFDVFIETRPRNAAAYCRKSSHQFQYNAPNGCVAEMTHFRSPDRHPLSEPGAARLEKHKVGTAHHLHIAFPFEILHSFDLKKTQEIGFTYRLQVGRHVQEFSCLQSEFSNYWEQPSLWSILRIVS